MDEAICDLKDFDFDEYEKNHEYSEDEEMDEPQELTKKQLMINKHKYSKKMKRKWGVNYCPFDISNFLL